MKATLRLFLLPALLFTLLAGCDSVEGSGRVTKEDRQVGDFSAVSVSGSMDVYITQGNTRSLSIEGEDNIVPLIESNIEDGSLHIRFRPNTNVRTHHDVKIYINTPVLEGVDLAGSGDVKVMSHFASDRGLRLSLSGSGDLSGSFDAPEVKVSVAGSGNVKLKGQTRDLNVNIAGSGNCEAEELLAETADINIAGSGNADVHASRELKANTLGSGDVRYKGDPQLNISKLGSGTVKKR